MKPRNHPDTVLPNTPEARYWDRHIRETVEAYVAQMGGVNKRGEPWSEADTEEVLERVRERVHSGQMRAAAMKRSRAGVILPPGVSAPR